MIPMKEQAETDIPMSNSTQEDREGRNDNTYEETQVQNYMHQVHQESSLHQFSVGQIEPGSHLDGWMTMYHQDSHQDRITTLVHVVILFSLQFL